MSRKSSIVRAALAASAVSVLASSTAWAGHEGFRAPAFSRASAPVHVTLPLAKIRSRGGPTNAAARLQPRWPTLTHADDESPKETHPQAGEQAPNERGGQPSSSNHGYR